MSFNSTLVKNSPSAVVALTGVTTGTTTPGPVFNISGALNPEEGSVIANVSAAVTTSSLVVKTLWEVSNDNVTWVSLFGINGAALVGVPATGTGTIVTTAYAQALPVNPSHPYIRLSVISTGATGGAGDNVTIGYNWRKRQY